MEPFSLLPWGLPSSPWPSPAQLLESPGASLPDFDLPVPWGHPAVPPWALSPCSFPWEPFGAPLAQHFQNCRCRCFLHSAQPELCCVLRVLSGGPGGGWQLLGALNALSHEPGAGQHLGDAFLSCSWASLLLVAGPGGKRREDLRVLPCHEPPNPTAGPDSHPRPWPLAAWWLLPAAWWHLWKRAADEPRWGQAV